MKALRCLAIVALLMGMLVSCTQAPGATSGKPLFYGAYATPIEEPWDGVIHTALQKAADAGKISYEHQDNIG
jgi:basic membrane protein A